MTFNEYQLKTRETAVYPDQGRDFVYPALGLAGEAGEVVDKVKKLWRDKDKQLDEGDRQEIAKEMGDVLWYLAQLATELDLELDSVSQLNIEKIASRQARGVIKGSGDSR